MAIVNIWRLCCSASVKAPLTIPQFQMKMQTMMTMRMVCRCGCCAVTTVQLSLLVAMI